MPMRTLAEPAFFDAPIGKGPKFEAMIANWTQEVDDCRVVFERIRPLDAAYIQAREALETLPPDEAGSARGVELRENANACLTTLVEAENRFAVPYARFWRRIYVGMKKDAVDSKREWRLSSGRPISAIDTRWPPDR